MKPSPDCQLLPPEAQAKWQYRYLERLGLLVADAIPSEQLNALAAFEADRAIEELYPPLQCFRGWLLQPDTP